MLLPLIADYQRFYTASARDEAHNAAFFGRFVAPSDAGMLIGAFEEDAAAARRPATPACTGRSRRSRRRTSCCSTTSTCAPSGVAAASAEALVAAAVDVARERGASHMRWFTALDNRRAQRLYERLETQRSAWFEYEIPIGTS